MAKESKIVLVCPQEEQRMVEIYQCFGWELVGTQQVVNHSRQVVTSLLPADGKEVLITSQNYVRLHFSRDKHMPNYHELLHMEKEYWAVKVIIRPHKKALLAIASVLIILSVLAFVVCLHYQGIVGEIVSAAVFAVSIGLFIGHGAQNKKIRKKNNGALAEAEERRKVIATRALAIVDGAPTK